MDIIAGVLVALQPRIGGYVVARWLAGPAEEHGTSVGAALRVVHEPAPVDLAAAERAAAAFLVALGVPRDSESLRATPGRMARAYAEMLTTRPFELTAFPNAGGYDELVLAKSIPVQSVCEHHMLPFLGVAHVGYLPGERILGLSKLARMVELFARRRQVQERLTKQVADWLQANLSPRGIGGRAGGRTPVHDDARSPGERRQHRHLVFGQLREDASSHAEFFALAIGQRVSVGGHHG